MFTKEDKDLNFLSHLLMVCFVCTKYYPKGKPTMIEIVGILQNNKDNFFRVEIIPKFQLDITHFLTSTSTSHKNTGGGQNSSTF